MYRKRVGESGRVLIWAPITERLRKPRIRFSKLIHFLALHLVGDFGHTRYKIYPVNLKVSFFSEFSIFVHEACFQNGFCSLSLPKVVLQTAGKSKTLWFLFAVPSVSLTLPLILLALRRL